MTPVFKTAMIAGLLALPCLGDVTPAPFFTDNAVLQRDKPVPVWGVAAPGEQVSVSFAGRTVETRADDAGAWRVTLDPLAASAEGRDLVIRGANTITLGNVVVGEVWLASGQSNMEWHLERTYDGPIDIPASASLPLVRELKIERRVLGEEGFYIWARNVSSRRADPAKDPFIAGVEHGGWQLPGPEASKRFSAVAYHFARDLHLTLGVPVGIINSSLGGTRIEAWMDPESLASAPAPVESLERWRDTIARQPEIQAAYKADLAKWQAKRAAAAAAGKPTPGGRPKQPWGPGHPATPSGLYNAMVEPLASYALRGVIWYQGEANARRATEYRELFPRLIRGWRKAFGQGDFPFYWAQLANYGSGDPSATFMAELREAQTRTLSVPVTGQVVTIDVGNVRDVHPRNKRDVGRRFARLALARDYGFEIAASGPVFSEAKREGEGFRLKFTALHGGLIAPNGDLDGFELAGADRVFLPARAVIEKDTVLVSTTEIADPVAVRYAWRNATPAGLFNQEGLPAVPFRTDDW